MRARWYDPSIGRFLNEDTYEGQIDNSLSLNFYTYVHNNPLTNIDPTGHYCVSNEGNNAHAGGCNSSTSFYLDKDKDFVGHPILINGKVYGFLGNNGNTINEAAHYQGNYWSMYKDDFLYIAWLTTDNPNF
ncbi:RHS repeat-associated core domain-containing protein [Paenibacillus wynnii]|uniref:RHS repeat-associated core domain-containing protein n=1 Tax=Paenibacillus wynnii TaxID=268407 RepID=UPI001F0A5EE1|nr:RHS repeat-associated core domain-containing protein [Paenibacillus wynnii]